MIIEHISKYDNVLAMGLRHFGGLLLVSDNDLFSDFRLYSMAREAKIFYKRSKDARIV